MEFEAAHMEKNITLRVLVLILVLMEFEAA